jgi:4-nitrophenyl phosphatase
MDLSQLRALIIDIDGTLWRGDQLLPGVTDLFTFLNKQNITFVVATNNTTVAPKTYWRRLLDLGIDLWSEQVITASVATLDYLKASFKVTAKIFIIGEPALEETIASGGFDAITTTSQPADVVVVGGDSTLTYQKLKNAILHIQRGAAFVGTNPDMLIPTEEGLVPEAGTTLAAIAAATGVQPIVIGKPEPYLFRMAITRMGSQPKHTAMLGDRLETDVRGATRAGLHSILVMTGIDNRRTIESTGIKPDLVVKNLTELIHVWQH